MEPQAHNSYFQIRPYTNTDKMGKYCFEEFYQNGDYVRSYTKARHVVEPGDEAYCSWAFSSVTTLGLSFDIGDYTEDGFYSTYLLSEDITNVYGYIHAILIVAEDYSVEINN